MSEFRRRLMMMQRAGESFPAELQKCEYVNNKVSNNKEVISYLDLRIYDITPEHGMYVDASLIDLQVDNALIGSIRTNRCILSGSYGWGYAWKQSGTGITATLTTARDLNRHVFSLNFKNDGLFKIDDLQTSIPSVSSNSGSRMCLFVTGDSIPGYYYKPGAQRMKVYSCKVSIGNDLARDLIPCYIKSGKTFKDIKGNTCPAGTIGFYDIVNKEFYTNDGGLEFEKGADI